MKTKYKPKFKKGDVVEVKLRMKINGTESDAFGRYYFTILLDDDLENDPGFLPNCVGLDKIAKLVKKPAKKKKATP